MTNDHFGVPTPGVAQIAKKHGVSEDIINAQLKMGIKVEHEHTKDTVIAREIALDHLNELPDYYTRLKKAEKSVNEVDGSEYAKNFPAGYHTEHPGYAVEPSDRKLDQAHQTAKETMENALRTEKWVIINLADVREGNLEPEEAEAVKKDLIGDLVGYARNRLDDEGIQLSDNELESLATETVERALLPVSEEIESEESETVNECHIEGDYIVWKNLLGEEFEGTIEELDSNVAVVRLFDGKTKTVDLPESFFSPSARVLDLAGIKKV